MNPSNWQPELSTIRERNEYAFNKSLFCDVEFSVVDSNGDKVTVPANKYVLAISSPVFEAMFYGKLAESKPTIDLPDCTKEGLQEMLRYVYSDEVNLTGSNTLEVLYLADKYMMPFLMEKCKKYFQDEVGPDEVLNILPDIQKIGDEELQKLLWDKVDLKSYTTLTSEPFLNASRELLCQILVRDTLTIRELDLFHAIDRWVEERIKEQGLESNGETRRSILGEEVIRLIRFPLMKEKMFAEVVLPCKILENDELIELFQLFNDVSPTTNMFIGKKRCFEACVLLIPTVRFKEIKITNNSWNYTREIEDAIGFTVNKAVDLVGVRMFGSKGSKYVVELKIIKGGEIISQLSSSFLTESEKIDGLYYGFTANLDMPIRLDPSVVYTVKAKISGPMSYYGQTQKEVEAVGNGIMITYKTASEPNNSTSVNCGQFPTLILVDV